MPEGPEIRRQSDALNAALGGQTLTDVWFAFPALQDYAPRLKGARILRFEPRGKALLTHFSVGLSMYSHNQLYGRWEVLAPGEVERSTRSPRVRLQCSTGQAVLYSASDIEIWPSKDLAQHPFLRRIGPDVLDESLNATEVSARLQEPRFARRRLSGLLLDQHFLAGLGNYLRAEILWRARLGADCKPADLTAQDLSALAQALLDVPRHSYRTRGASEDALMQEPAFRFEVFKREGEACRRCGTPIAKISHGGRPLFYCPHCQAST